MKYHPQLGWLNLPSLSFLHLGSKMLLSTCVFFSRQTWRSSCYLLSGITMLCFIIGLFAIDSDEPSQEKDKRVDWFGAFLVTAGLVQITFVLSQAGLAPKKWATPCMIPVHSFSLFSPISQITNRHYCDPNTRSNFYRRVLLLATLSWKCAIQTFFTSFDIPPTTPPQKLHLDTSQWSTRRNDGGCLRRLLCFPFVGILGSTLLPKLQNVYPSRIRCPIRTCICLRYSMQRFRRTYGSTNISCLDPWHWYSVDGHCMSIIRAHHPECHILGICFPGNLYRCLGGRFRLLCRDTVHSQICTSPWTKCCWCAFQYHGAVGHCVGGYSFNSGLQLGCRKSRSRGERYNCAIQGSSMDRFWFWNYRYVILIYFDQFPYWLKAQ